VPTSSASIPGTAAIASALATACGVSIITVTRVAALSITVSSPAFTGLKSNMRHGAADRAMAERWIFELRHDLARLVRRVDMRHDDAEGAAVQRPRRHGELLTGTRTNGAMPGVQRRDGHLGRGFQRDRAGGSRSMNNQS